MMKLVLFAYTRETFTSCKIECLAEENLHACWLTQEQVSIYRTIDRFCVSNDVQEFTNKVLNQLTEYLRARNLIAALFIDGTKILEDANKYSFVWKKNTIRFDQLNCEKLLTMMTKLRKAYALKQTPEGTTLTVDMIDELLTWMELCLDELEKDVETTKRLSPNPAKQQRRTLKSQVRKLNTNREKLLEQQALIPESLIPKGNRRKITVNPSWEYHKEKQKERLSTPDIQKIYGRRKIDVETRIYEGLFGFHLIHGFGA